MSFSRPSAARIPRFLEYLLGPLTRYLVPNPVRARRAVGNPAPSLERTLTAGDLPHRKSGLQAWYQNPPATGSADGVSVTGTRRKGPTAGTAGRPDHPDGSGRATNSPAGTLPPTPPSTTTSTRSTSRSASWPSPSPPPPSFDAPTEPPAAWPLRQDCSARDAGAFRRGQLTPCQLRSGYHFSGLSEAAFGVRGRTTIDRSH